MKVFIFGAGASKGSQKQVASDPGFGLAPPLVNELFLPRFANYNLSGPYVQPSRYFLSPAEWSECAYNAEQKKSLEQWLTKRWSEIDAKKQTTSKFAERAFFAKVAFYIWNLLQAISNTYTPENGYTSLLRILKQYDEPFGLISFNYDTLLDRAIQDVFGYEMRRFADYEAINYVKPHGSVNWIMPFRGDEGQISREGSFDVGTRLDAAIARMYNGDPFIFSRTSIYNPRHNDLNHFEYLINAHGGIFFPLIFMPLTTKLYSTVDGFANNVIDRSKDLLHEAQEIFLVGYRAQDDIIKEMFRGIAQPSQTRLITKLHVVGVGDSDQVMRDALNLSDKLEAGNIYGDGFMSFAESYRGS